MPFFCFGGFNSSEGGKETVGVSPRSVIVPIWVSFERRILSFTQMALLEAFSFGIMTFFELPTGALADLIGRRKTIMLGWLLSGIGNIYLAFAENILMFALSFAIFSFGAVLISGSDVALIFDSLKEQDKEDFFPKYNSRAGLIFRIGLILATLSGGYLYKFWIGTSLYLDGIY